MLKYAKIFLNIFKKGLLLFTNFLFLCLHPFFIIKLQSGVVLGSGGALDMSYE